MRIKMHVAILLVFVNWFDAKGTEVFRRADGPEVHDKKFLQMKKGSAQISKERDSSLHGENEVSLSKNEEVAVKNYRNKLKTKANLGDIDKALKEHRRVINIYSNLKDKEFEILEGGFIQIDNGL